MSKPIIAVDMDDVLSASTEGVRLFINHHYGTNHTSEDYAVPGEYHNYWGKVWGGDEAQNREWYEHYLSSGLQLRLKPVSGAVSAIAELQHRYELVIITAREVQQLAQTEAWLHEHFPRVFRQVEFLNAHPKGKEATKAIILQEVGAGYFIDDKVENCLEAHESGVSSILFGDYGWHKPYELPEGITRCKDWAAVLEYFNGINRS